MTRQPQIPSQEELESYIELAHAEKDRLNKRILDYERELTHYKNEKKSLEALLSFIKNSSARKSIWSGSLVTTTYADHHPFEGANIEEINLRLSFVMQKIKSHTKSIKSDKDGVQCIEQDILNLKLIKDYPIRHYVSDFACIS